MNATAPRPREDVPSDPRDLPGPFPFRRTLEVRFGDTDAMGHVNNAVYLTYCEAARVSYFEAATGRSFLDAGDHRGRGVGMEAGEGPRHRWSFILAEARVTFRSPAYFGETLTVEVRTSKIGRSSMPREDRITGPASHLAPARLIAVCESVQVGYDYEHEHPVALPEDLVGLLEAFEGRSLRD